jgi:ABC-2 type transport system permease protein
MLAIAKREILSFFTTPMGYIILAVFFTLNGLFLWVFSNNFNLIGSGFADLNLYYELMPWLFLFLVPAIGMKSLAEEIKLETIGLLMAKPIFLWELVLGKLFGLLFLILSSLLLSFVYAFAILHLKLDQDVFDWGAFNGSFLGLLFLAGVFCSITLWCSSLTRNQVIAFLLSTLFCLLHFYGWGELALYFSDNRIYEFFNSIGIQSHYSQMSKGILASSDITYFLGQMFIFNYLAVFQLKKIKQ